MDVSEAKRLRALEDENAKLKREGLAVNRKKLFRLYREEKLSVWRRGGRKRAIGTQAPLLAPPRPNERWSLDFVSDQFTDGRRFTRPSGQILSTERIQKWIKPGGQRQAIAPSTVSQRRSCQASEPFLLSRLITQTSPYDQVLKDRYSEIYYVHFGFLAANLGAIQRVQRC